MFYWSLIFLGVLILSASISNPVYRVSVGKILKKNFFLIILLRFLMFILGFFVIFIGLYLESIT